MAIQTGAPVLSTVAIRTDPKYYTIYIEPPIYANKETDINELTNKIMEPLNEQIKKWPGQLDWMMWLIRSEEAKGIKPIDPH